VFFSCAGPGDSAKNLYRVEQIELVEPNNMEIIFGRDFKLDAADPYLFYAYEFRRYCLIAKLIVTVGYGFFDDHINKMLAQALRDDVDRKLLVVARCMKRDEVDQKRQEVATKLGVEDTRVIPLKGSAKSFLEQLNLAQLLSEYVPKAADSPF
jgi:hypothetical protein